MSAIRTLPEKFGNILCITSISSISWSIIAGFILLTCLFATEAEAQQHFGVHYHPRTEIEDVHNDLSVLQDLGVQTLMVDYYFPSEQLELINQYNFSITANTDYQYPTRHRLQYRSGSLKNALSEINTRFSDDLTPGMIVLFRHGAITSENFLELLSTYEYRPEVDNEAVVTYITPFPPPEHVTDIISSYILEIRSSEDLEGITDFSGIASIYYNPVRDTFNLRDFQEIMEIIEDHEVPFFLNWEWFVYNVTDDPLLAEVIQEYASNPDAIFPNPRPEEDGLEANLLILILLALWGTFIVHYVFVPPYQKSLNRYFLHHNFFVGDIIYRRLRIGFPNFIVLLQQGALAGIFLSGLLYLHLTELGREALTNNLIFLAGLPGPVPVFFLAMGGVIVLNSLFIFWIYIVHRHLQSINQIAVILLWPQHLNLIIISALIALLAAGISGMAITILIVLYLATLFGTFLLAAFDASRFIYIRFYYFPLTIGLYVAALIFLYIYVLSGNGYVEAWELADTMP